jgi:hypothetical protein
MVVTQVIDHAQPPPWQAGVIAVLSREPGVEINPTFHEIFSSLLRGKGKASVV